MDSHQYQLAVSEAILRIGQMCEKIQERQQQPQQQNHLDSRIKAPHSYSGSPKENLQLYLFQLESYFRLKGIHDLERLHYMPSLLTGHALLWFHTSCVAIQDKQRNSFSSWTSFISELRQQFLPENQQQLLRRQLRQLQQRYSIQDYINNYRSIICLVDKMEEEDKISYFVEGLSMGARNELLYRNPTSLEAAISIASAYFSSNPKPNNGSSYQAHYSESNRTAPMELGHLSRKPKPKVGKKICSYHGEGSHSSLECRHLQGKSNQLTNTSKPWAKSAPRANAIASHESFLVEEINQDVQEANSLTQEHLDLVNGSKAKLLTFKGSINGHSAVILIDSGATHDYLSTDFTKRHKLGQPQGKSAQVALADGTLMDTFTLPSKLPLRIQGFRDEVKFHVFPIAGYDAILGRPWLYRHNPSINWRQQSMEFVTENDTILLQDRNDVPIVAIAHDKSPSNFLNLRQSKNVKEIYLINVVQDAPTAPEQIPDILKPLIAKFASVFVAELPGLPPIRDIEQSIETNSSQPISRSSYRMSPKELKELKSQIDELLKQGFIRPSSSPWASPVLFAKKKDGQLRLCTDYRSLNAITVRNKYPIPRIDEILDSLAGAVIFSKIDLRSGYYQIRIKAEDIPKTAFKTHFGHYEYRVMPFGLSNAPATFMHLMHSIFHDLLNNGVTIYLDDILIYSKNIQEHVLQVEEVIKRLHEHKLYAKLSKCTFCVPQIAFLGYIVSSEGVAVDPGKVSAIHRLKRPKKLAEVQSFLGLIGYYRKFIENFALVSAPLTHLTKKDVPFRWSSVEETAFEQLKKVVSEAPVLRLPDFSKPFLVTTDASSLAVAGILSQNSEDGQHPICFESHKLNAAEGNYPAHELEAYAIVYCLQQWRCYLEGSKFIVQTDHQALRYLMTQKHLSRRLTRWVEFLQQFEFEIQYKPGSENTAADALSRLCVIDSNWPEHMFQYLEDGALPTGLDEAQKLQISSESSKFLVQNENLFYTANGNKVPYISFCFRADLIHNHHRSLGHMSASDLYQILQQRYYWPGMRSDISNWLESCTECQLSASNRKSVATEPLHPLSVAPPFFRWGVDFIGPLPTSKNGNKYILVAIDYTTKWPVAIAVKNCKAETLADFLRNYIFLQFGCPSEIVSDRGSAFMDASLKLYLQEMKVKHNLTSAYHPRSNGVAERFNGLLGKIIQKYCSTTSRNSWEQYLDVALLACRIRAHRATGYSPFFLVYGVEAKIPGDVLLPSMNELDELDITGARLDSINSLKTTRLRGKSRLEAQKEAMIKTYSKRLQPGKKQNLTVGSYVLLRNEAKLKFEPNWLGPLKITTCYPNGLFEIESLKGEKYASRVHRDRLKLAKMNHRSKRVWRNPKMFDKRVFKSGGM